ncbi:hypothetical protein DACRYDRAFT_88149 [Dacryopinax primogenitus]|uniref:Uncharacterized protein n=1 Tax=Dacryopinax primogenitus (strain DJM 731) TaxID=1858805 RepID=M5GAW3_DACPD|nr:uncharacterized protein DACRYDRAFT_88149 [Dacryopinax primogenitus]EJU03122.1 hypothetical protein DACRYDRAFT_88149 [Dacryopinax primogenitus]
MSDSHRTELLDPKRVAENLDIPVRGNLDDYVNSAAFDINCSQKAIELARALSSDNSDWTEGPGCNWSSLESLSTPPSAETGTHEISKLEARLYYAGISPKDWPTRVWRSSADVFEVPTGPEAYVRRMRLVDVPGTHEFAKNGLWDTVCDWVERLLKEEDVSVSSIDFARFTWRNKAEDREIDSEEEEEVVEEEGEEGAKEDDEDAYDSFAPVKPVEGGEQYFTNPTIWIGVFPESLTGLRAFEVAEKIRAFLDALKVKEVDIAFRESIARSIVGNGPALYPPVESGDPLEEFIDSVSVPLSIPISGTLGPYFQHNGKLYAITARHNLFLAADGNAPYRYNTSASKRDVVVMGNPAFTNYQNAIQARIGNLNETVKSLRKKIASLKERVGNGIGLPGTRALLAEQEGELRKTARKISSLKQHSVTMSKNWSKLSDRIIGHIVWSPPIGVGPNRFTQDVCVVELKKSKFTHFIGNVLSLGPKYSETDFTTLMHQRTDVPSDFEYPTDGLLVLRGMFTTDPVYDHNSLGSHRERTRHVIKNGFFTGTTVGNLPRFMSFVRKYFTTGTLESLELAIFLHENETGTFSKSGDSGALIFVGLLTGGTNKGTDGSDITYATPFTYIWDLVLSEFPGANLYFQDIPAFLAAPV